MKIKTFQLQFAEEDLNHIREVAASLNMSMKAFMLAAIDEKLNKENN